MRLLVLADNEPEWAGDLPKTVSENEVDVVVTVGDLIGVWLKEAGVTHLHIPVIGVYGNHCNGDYLKELGIANLHLRRAEIMGTTFCGLEGAVRYKEGTRDILYTQDEYTEMVRNLPSADILVTHCPPHGVNDHEDKAHQGILALESWVKSHRPRVLIHGHTYPEVPMKMYGTTRVVYVHGGRIVEV